MPTLKYIAAELGVSESLVSKVLNNRLGNTGVRPELIERIRQKAVEVDYRKNASSMALLGGRHNVLGTYMHHMGRPGSYITEGIVQGISGAATRQQQRLFLDYYTSDDDFLSFRDSMRRSVMDGLIVAGVPHPNLHHHFLAVQEAGLPMVSIHDQPIDLSIPNISIEDVEIGRMATAHLIEQGCTRIAHLIDKKGRYEGYRQALSEAGLPLDPALVMPRNEFPFFSHEKGRAAVRDWLKRDVRFDGVAAQSDEEAVGAMNELLRAGIRVPEDVKIIGVDNAPYCPFAPVPLSSVNQFQFERGAEAVRVLLTLIERKPTLPQPPKPQLVIRESSRAV